jgi:chromosome segregation ATPase
MESVMSDILKMDWPKIRRLTLDESHDVRMAAKDIILSSQSRIENSAGDCKAVKAAKADIHKSQQLLGKLNHHIKTINKADNQCKLSLRARLKEQKEARNAMSIEMAEIKKDRSNMINEINQLKDKIKELEKLLPKASG